VLVFPSGFLRDVFRRFALEGEVVYNVVDTARFRFRPREPLRPVLLSCRLLERLYAVENTLRAFARVRERHPDARLLVVGGGDQAERLQTIAREEGIEGVEFVGPVPHGEIPAWMDRADLFVNSSREDNMPHSVIEAFASGLPVVTTAAGGIPYIVEHERNGLLVEIDDPAAMADAVLSLLADPERARGLVAQGRADCRERYSWEAARQRWSALYRRLAGSRRAAPLRASMEAE
jgi:glycosyltransferase involved in cell wall biosynthesis